MEAWRGYQDKMVEKNFCRRASLIIWIIHRGGIAEGVNPFPTSGGLGKSESVAHALDKETNSHSYRG